LQFVVLPNNLKKFGANVFKKFLGRQFPGCPSVVAGLVLITIDLC